MAFVIVMFKSLLPSEGKDAWSVRTGAVETRETKAVVTSAAVLKRCTIALCDNVKIRLDNERLTRRKYL